jgi:hypothetical protein
MPNEQTTVPLFTAGEVLTAADMNLSAGTGVPVFSNTTTRDAGFGGAGEKVLAEGQLCYLSDSNIVQYYTGAAWATVGPSSSGAVLQVKSAIKTTSFSTTNTAMQDVTDVTISITPTSASNKVFVIVAGMTGSADNANTWRINLLRNSTDIAQSTGSGASEQTLSPFTASSSAGDSFTIAFLDSPATTSATTYKIQLASGGGGATYIGRQGVNDNRRSVTTITAMEVTP